MSDDEIYYVNKKSYNFNYKLIKKNNVLHSNYIDQVIGCTAISDPKKYPLKRRSFIRHLYWVIETWYEDGQLEEKLRIKQENYNIHFVGGVRGALYCSELRNQKLAGAIKDNDDVLEMDRDGVTQHQKQMQDELRAEALWYQKYLAQKPPQKFS